MVNHCSIFFWWPKKSIIILKMNMVWKKDFRKLVSQLGYSGTSPPTASCISTLVAVWLEAPWVFTVVPQRQLRSKELLRVFFYALFQWGLEQTMGDGGMLKRSQAFIARESLHSFALAFHTWVLDGFSTKTSVFGWKLLLSALGKSKSLRVSEANGCQTETLSGSQWFQSCIMMSFYPPPEKNLAIRCG